METIGKQGLAAAMVLVSLKRGLTARGRRRLIFPIGAKPPLGGLNPERKVLWLPTVLDLSPAAPQINSHSGWRV